MGHFLAKDQARTCRTHWCLARIMGSENEIPTIIERANLGAWAPHCLTAGPAPRVPRVGTLRQPRRWLLTAFRRVPIPSAAGLPAGRTQNRLSRGDRPLQSAQAYASAHRGCCANGSAPPAAFAADSRSEAFPLCLPPRSEHHIRTGRA